MTPDGHAAAAATVLGVVRAVVESDDFPADDPVGPYRLGMLHLGIANVHALLASRPTVPDNELVRRAINAETTELRGENGTLRAELIEATEETDRMAGEVDRLRYKLLSNGQELLDEVRHMADDPEGAYRDAAETWMAMLQRTLTEAAVPSTGEDQNLPNSARARAGMTVIHMHGGRAVLSHRKDDDSGWWLKDEGGLDDWGLDSDSWQLIDEPVPDEGNEISGEGTEAPCVPPRATDAEAVTAAPLPGPSQVCVRCGHLKTEHGFPHSIECDAEGCICGAFEPVPDEGNAPARSSVTVEAADHRGIERHDEGSETGA